MTKTDVTQAKRIYVSQSNKARRTDGLRKGQSVLERESEGANVCVCVRLVRCVVHTDYNRNPA